MKNQQHNQLFLVCPFCQMESFIIRNFGEAFFLTAPASVFHFDDEEFLQAVKKVVWKEQITDIYFVGEVSCCFIQNALNKKRLSDLRCESEIEELISTTDTAYSLTEKLLTKQMYDVSCERVFGKEIALGAIRLHALMTSKRTNTILSVCCDFLKPTQQSAMNSL
jgi:hypothetical protein